MNSRLFRRLAAAAAVVVLAGVGWWLIGPVQLGGPTGFVAIRGQSMEPSIEGGDLVLSRRHSGYRVGEVVLFRNPELGVKVLHRIIRVEDGRFVTKGDNNDFVDSFRPRADDVLGEQWLVIPVLGRAVELLREPVNAGVVFFLIALLLLGGGREISRRRRPGAPRPIDDGVSAPGLLHAAPVRALLTASAVALVAFAALGAAALSRPAERTETVAGAFAHAGVFSYGADVARNTVYPDGRVDVGEPVYLRLVRNLEVGFAYRFESTVPADVRGSVGLDAIVSESGGWTRTIPVAPAVPFDGDAGGVQGTLSLVQVQRMLNRVGALTGASPADVVVSLVPRVETMGYAGTDVVDASFAPRLDLELDGTALRLPAAADSAGVDATAGDVLTPREEASATREVAATLGLGPVALPVWQARTAAAIGVCISLLLLGISALLLARVSRRGEAAEILSTHGSRIVTVEQPVPDGRWVSDVEDIESIVRAATHFDRLILHTVAQGRHEFLVDDGVTILRYRVRDGVADTRLTPAVEG